MDQDVNNVVMGPVREVPDFLQEVRQPGRAVGDQDHSVVHNARHCMGPRDLVVNGLDRPKRDAAVNLQLLNEGYSRRLVFNQDAVGFPFVIVRRRRPGQFGEGQPGDV